ncbi:hypothetical protein SI65_07787 [Aspergillus cristatus]|uniref:Uncharacterized protein n=1 Tax=Aspergillus cristatus TaxID=573508 RepID=A0A1E3B783_ASPCR|nr:hypothetical protein SI65_07787 [Aspergillus cristatus]
MPFPGIKDGLPKGTPRIHSPVQPIIERGDMNFIERMRAEAAWWIAASKGDIKIAVVLGVNRTKPELVLEEWRAAKQDGDNQDYGDDDTQMPTPIESQMVAMALSEKGSIELLGYRLPYDFMITPANAQEGDFVYTTEDLEQYAKHVWMRQGFISVDNL